MKAVEETVEGFVEITVRRPVYERLVETLRRFSLCEETMDDYGWLGRFLDNLETKRGAAEGSKTEGQQQ